MRPADLDQLAGGTAPKHSKPLTREQVEWANRQARADRAATRLAERLKHAGGFMDDVKPSDPSPEQVMGRHLAMLAKDYPTEFNQARLESFRKHYPHIDTGEKP